MSVLKNTMLVLMVALATSSAVAEDKLLWTRVMYIEKCEEAAAKFKVSTLEYNSVCNCAAQYVSFVVTGGNTEWADYTIVMPNDLGVDATRYCRAVYQSNPDAFVKKFGTLTVSNGENQEAR